MGGHSVVVTLHACHAGACIGVIVIWEGGMV